MKSPVVLYVTAAIFVVALGFAGFMWFAFARPQEAQEGNGAITQKTFQAAHTATRMPPGGLRQSYTQQEFHIPDGYLFHIRLDGGADLVYWMEAHAAEPFDVGGRVRVRYLERGVPPFWVKRYVDSIKPLAGGG